MPVGCAGVVVGFATTPTEEHGSGMSQVCEISVGSITLLHGHTVFLIEGLNDVLPDETGAGRRIRSVSVGTTPTFGAIGAAVPRSRDGTKGQETDGSTT